MELIIPKKMYVLGFSDFGGKMIHEVGAKNNVLSHGISNEGF